VQSRRRERVLLGRVGCYYTTSASSPTRRFRGEPGAQRQSARPVKAIQSAHIIRAHITEGLTLAREAGCPRRWWRSSPSITGTSEITYFLDRAKERGRGRHRDGRISHYPGPQAALDRDGVAMLADSVEAALRVIDDLTPAKIGGRRSRRSPAPRSTPASSDDAPITCSRSPK